MSEQVTITKRPGWRLAAPYPCPRCGRGFANLVDMQQHLLAKHQTTLESAIRNYASSAPAETESAVFEDALVRIVNSLTHAEAVEIAQLALMGQSNDDV